MTAQAYKDAANLVAYRRIGVDYLETAWCKLYRIGKYINSQIAQIECAL